MVKEGDKHFRPRLAETLEHLAESGSSDIFYRGELGESIIAELKQKGSIMTMEDLKSYR